MNYEKIIKQSWKLVWQYRALWIFGLMLALTTTSGVWWLAAMDQDDVPRGISIKINQDTTIFLPGEGLHVDFTDPDGASLYIENLGSVQEIRDINPIIIDGEPVDVWAIIIIGLVWILTLFITTLIARYVGGAALIRMVEVGEEQGERQSFWQGMRMGFSRFAWRLFTVDLLVFLLALLAVAAMLALVILPLLILTTGSAFGNALAIVSASAIFFIGLAALLFGGAVISIFVQVIRRACIQDDIGVLAGIRRGVITVFQYPAEVFVVWLMWLGVRLVWMVISVPIFLVMIPVILVLILVGVLVAAVPALITAGISGLFLDGILPWIIGALFGLPLFMLVVAAPMAFVSGLVEIFKSNLWTLSYREMRPIERDVTEQERMPTIQEGRTPEVDASGA